jgi:hypothetical protein
MSKGLIVIIFGWAPAYAVDVNAFRTPEAGAHSPCGQTGLLST